MEVTVRGYVQGKVRRMLSGSSEPHSVREEWPELEKSQGRFKITFIQCNKVPMLQVEGALQLGPESEVMSIFHPSQP